MCDDIGEIFLKRGQNNELRNKTGEEEWEKHNHSK